MTPASVRVLVRGPNEHEFWQTSTPANSDFELSEINLADALPDDTQEVEFSDGTTRFCAVSDGAEWDESSIPEPAESTEAIEPEPSQESTFDGGQYLSCPKASAPEETVDTETGSAANAPEPGLTSPASDAGATISSMSAQQASAGYDRGKGRTGFCPRNPNGYWLEINRSNICSEFKVTIEHWEISTKKGEKPKHKGDSYWWASYYINGSPKSLAIEASMRFAYWYGWGAEPRRYTATFIMRCAGDCKTDIADAQERVTVDRVSSRITGWHRTTHRAKVDDKGKVKVAPLFTLISAGVDSAQSPAIRCDRVHYISGKGGCVYDFIEPIIHLRLGGKFPESADHIRDAQGSPMFAPMRLQRHFWGKSTT